MPADFRSLSTVRHLAKVTYADEAVVADFLGNPEPHLARVAIPRHGSSASPRDAWDITTAPVKAFFRELRVQFDAFPEVS